MESGITHAICFVVSRMEVMEDNGSYAARLRRSFAENLRAARKSVGLSQSRLAKASGVTQKSISGVEAATTNPTLSTMARLAESVSAEVPALLSEREGE